MRSASHHITFVLKSSYLVVIFFSPLLLLMVMKLQSKIKINLLLKKCVPLHKTTKGIVQIKNTSLPYYTSSSMFTTTITYLLKKILLLQQLITVMPHDQPYLSCQMVVAATFLFS